jgi:vacuolar protein sorting-associated protein 35
MFHVGVASA